MTGRHTTITAPIGPTSDLDSWPTHRAFWGHGGLRTVNSEAERDAIPFLRREKGMVVCVFPAAGTTTYWVLNEDLLTWTNLMIPVPGLADLTAPHIPYWDGTELADTGLAWDEVQSTLTATANNIWQSSGIASFGFGVSGGLGDQWEFTHRNDVDGGTQTTIARYWHGGVFEPDRFWRFEVPLRLLAAFQSPNQIETTNTVLVLGANSQVFKVPITSPNLGTAAPGINSIAWHNASGRLTTADAANPFDAVAYRQLTGGYVPTSRSIALLGGTCISAVESGGGSNLTQDRSWTISMTCSFEPPILPGVSPQFWGWDKTWRVVDWTHLSGRPTSFPPAPHTLGSHSDTAFGTPSVNAVPVWNGTQWLAGILTYGQVSDAVGATTDLTPPYLPKATGSHTVVNSTIYDNGALAGTTLPFQALRLGAGAGDMDAPGIQFTGYRGKTGFYAPSADQVCVRLDDGSDDGSHPRFCIGPDRVSTDLIIEAPNILVNGHAFVDKVVTDILITTAEQTILEITTPVYHPNTQYYFSVVLQEVQTVNQDAILTIYANGVSILTETLNLRTAGSTFVIAGESTPGLDVEIVWQFRIRMASGTASIMGTDNPSFMTILAFSPPVGGSGGGGGDLTGNGSANRLARWTSATNLVTSLVYDNTSGVSVGADPLAGQLFTVHGSATIINDLTNQNPQGSSAALPVWVNDAGVFKSQSLASLKANLGILWGDIGGIQPVPAHGLDDHTDVLLNVTITDHSFLRYSVAEASWVDEIVNIPVGANPTASVGLAAVNGSAGTWMRSDAAPPLSQSITPTWTAKHTFNPSGGTGISLRAPAGTLTASSFMAVWETSPVTSAVDVKAASLAAIQTWLGLGNYLDTSATDQTKTGKLTVNKITVGETSPTYGISVNSGNVGGGYTRDLKFKASDVAGTLWSMIGFSATGNMATATRASIYLVSNVTTATADGSGYNQAPRFDFLSNGDLQFHKTTAPVLWGKLAFGGVVANRTWTLPDKSGTVALTSDIVAPPTLGTIEHEAISTSQMLITPASPQSVGGVLKWTHEIVSAPRWTNGVLLTLTGDVSGGTTLLGDETANSIGCTVEWANGNEEYDARYSLLGHTHVPLDIRATTFFPSLLAFRGATEPGYVNDWGVAVELDETLEFTPLPEYFVRVVSAPKWKTARTLSLTGAVTGSASVDGTANVSIATTLVGSFVPTSRTLTFVGAGIATVAPTGAQDLSASRSWTITVPATDVSGLVPKTTTLAHASANAAHLTITPAGAQALSAASIAWTHTVVSAPKWTTARTLSWTGDATGSMSVDGSANASAALGVVWANGYPTYDARYAPIGGGGAPHNLDSHTDVTIAAPASDHVLAYDSVSSQWTNQKFNTDAFPHRHQPYDLYLTTFSPVLVGFRGLFEPGYVDDNAVLIELGPTLSLSALPGVSTLGVVSAPKWTTARTLSLTGAVTGSASVDGSANVAIATTLVGGVPTTRTLTFVGAGVATVTPTGAQDLSVNRSWTITVPATDVSGLVPKTTTLTHTSANAHLTVSPTGAQDLTTNRAWTHTVVSAPKLTLATYSNAGSAMTDAQLVGFLNAAGGTDYPTADIGAGLRVERAAAGASAAGSFQFWSAGDANYNHLYFRKASVNGLSWQGWHRVTMEGDAGSGWVPTSRSLLISPQNAAHMTVGTTGTNLSTDRTWTLTVVSAPKWTTARALSWTGDATGSMASVDGSANASAALTVVWANGYPTYDARYLRVLPAHTLDFHSDVTITTPADNQFLRYDSGTSQWINETVTFDTTGLVPQTRTLTLVAGTGISVSPTGAQDLTANRSWTITNTASVTVPVGANPTATIGLAVVNGSAATFMRSDAAPPLSQAIVPTWTGKHTFSPSSPPAIATKAAAATLASGSVVLVADAEAVTIARDVKTATLAGLKTWLDLSTGFYLDTSATNQTKTGKLTIDDVTIGESSPTYGISVNLGVVGGGFARDLKFKGSDAAGTLWTSMGLAAYGNTATATATATRVSVYVLSNRTTAQADASGYNQFPRFDFLPSGNFEFWPSGTAAGKLATGGVTAQRTWTFPDKTGTVAMTSDITAPDLSGYVPITRTLSIVGAGIASAVAVPPGTDLSVNREWTITVPASHPHAFGDIGGVVSPSLLGRTNLGTGVVELINVTTKLLLSGQALDVVSAPKWTVARTLSWSGDAAGAMSVDGSANADAVLTVAWANGKPTFDGYYVPVARTVTLTQGAGITITGTATQALSSNVAWTVAAVPADLSGYVTLATDQTLTGAKTWNHATDAAWKGVRTTLAGVEKAYLTAGGALWLAGTASLKTTQITGTGLTEVFVGENPAVATAAVQSMTKANFQAWVNPGWATGTSGAPNRIAKWSGASSLVVSSLLDTGSLVTCDVPLNVTGNIVSTGFLSGTRVRVMPTSGSVGNLKRWLAHGAGYSGVASQTGNIMVKLPTTATVSTNNVMARFDIHIVDYGANRMDVRISVSGYVFYNTATQIYWLNPRVTVNSSQANISKVKLGYDKMDSRWVVAIKPNVAWGYPNVQVDAFIGFTGSYSAVWESTPTTVTWIDDTYYSTNIKDTLTVERDTEFTPIQSLDTTAVFQTKAAGLEADGVRLGMNSGSNPAIGVTGTVVSAGTFARDFRIRGNNGANWGVSGLGFLFTGSTVTSASLYLLSNVSQAVADASGYNQAPRYSFLPNGDFQCWLTVPVSGSLRMGGVTASRIWTMPDKTGTVAMLDDLGVGNVSGTGAPGFIPVWTTTSGLGNSILMVNGTSVEFDDPPPAMSSATALKLFGRTAADNVLREIDQPNLVAWLGVSGGISFPTSTDPWVGTDTGWKVLAAAPPVTMTAGGGGWTIGITPNTFAPFSHTHPYTDVVSFPAGQLAGRYPGSTGALQPIAVGAGLQLDATALSCTITQGVTGSGAQYTIPYWTSSANPGVLGQSILSNVGGQVDCAGNFAVTGVVTIAGGLIFQPAPPTLSDLLHLYGRPAADGTLRAYASSVVRSWIQMDIVSVSGLVDALNGKANLAHTHVIADVTNLQSTLDAKALKTTTLTGALSIAGGGDLSVNRTFSLVGDGTPATAQYYGTPSEGGGTTRGWYNLPSGGGSGNLTGGGTANAIAMWSGATSLGNSPLTVSGSTVFASSFTVSEDFAVSGLATFNGAADNATIHRLFGRSTAGGALQQHSASAVASWLGVDSKVSGSGAQYTIPFFTTAANPGVLGQSILAYYSSSSRVDCNGAFGVTGFTILQGGLQLTGGAFDNPPSRVLGKVGDGTVISVTAAALLTYIAPSTTDGLPYVMVNGQWRVLTGTGTLVLT